MEIALLWFSDFQSNACQLEKPSEVTIVIKSSELCVSLLLMLRTTLQGRSFRRPHLTGEETENPTGGGTSSALWSQVAGCGAESLYNPPS